MTETGYELAERNVSECVWYDYFFRSPVQGNSPVVMVEGRSWTTLQGV